MIDVTFISGALKRSFPRINAGASTSLRELSAACKAHYLPA